MTQQRRNNSLLIALVLGLLATGIPCYAHSPQYEATAVIQIHSVQPSFLADGRQLGEIEYNRFVNTQLELLRLPMVLDRALENADVARLPIVLEQQDKRGWLTKAIQARHAENTELVYVSIVTNSAEASEKIVNAVVDAYLNFINDVARLTNNNLLSSLRIEERRQRQFAQTFQESIRRATREAALRGVAPRMNIGVVQEESLQRDVALAEVKLTTMRAQRRGIAERMENSDIIPVPMRLNPELRVINEQRELLVQQREARMEALSRPDNDARVGQLNRQIEHLDERIKAITTGVDSRRLETLQNHFRLQEEANLFQLDQDIRVQEILVEELRNKYNEQLLKGLDQAENVLDVSFEQSQLERVHRTLDKIEDRILAITSEQRAPGRITPLSRAVVSVKPAE